jgi:hypothetical protein
MLGWRMRRPRLVKNSGRSPPFLTENEDELLMSSFLKMILFYNVHTHNAHGIKSSQLSDMFYYVTTTRTDTEIALRKILQIELGKKSFILV